MAVYKKKTKTSKNQKGVSDKNSVDSSSSTAQIFNSLDRVASKTELWIQKRQKYILSILGVCAISLLSWLLYDHFVNTPKENRAVGEMFFAQQLFNQATESFGNRKDSLFLAALEGNKQHHGFLKIIKDYPNTKTGNIAHYNAGICYMNLGNYQEAIKQLKQFHSDDVMISAVSKGCIGDALVFQKKYQLALEYYEKAIASNNSFVCPKYLFKAGLASSRLGKSQKAVEYFTSIKNEYPQSREAQNIDLLIAKSKGKE